MRYTRTALGLLIRQYRSVLHKCWLINIGLFALGAASVLTAGEAGATYYQNDNMVWIETGGTHYAHVDYDYISFSGNTSLSYDGFKLNGSGNATGIDFGSTSAYQTDAMKHLATTGSVADTLN